MNTTNTMSATAPNDADLVAASLSGNRDAFGEIVARYQSLICSLAYSATGSLNQSEDLAQETFLAAWKYLRHLREPNKLRAWLCGIARNQINNCLRREGREPVRDAELLENASESPSTEPLPHDQTITREEEAILWRSLERIPEIYREPLVLFYREHQSIENVAGALDLSEDAVKQRLARGRKLLHEQVLAFVEGALGRTSPGKAFTIGVIASLPALLTVSAKAATIGAVAAKGSATAKATAVAGVFNAILGPLIGILGPWLQYRVFLQTAETEREREGIKSYYRKLLGLILAFAACLMALIFFGRKYATAHPTLFAVALIGLVAAYTLSAIGMAIWSNRLFKSIRAERLAQPQTVSRRRGWEYRSRAELFGLPLVHMRFNFANSSAPSHGRTPVKAWIAGGDFAFGCLFAVGGLAVAPVSMGGLAVGLVPLGGFALGALAVGGFALGGWTFGGFAVGWQSFGGCALAWNAAKGGMAIAREFALGGIAQAAQANNDIASQFFSTRLFFQGAEILARYIAWLNLLWLLPLLSWWRKLKDGVSSAR